MTRIYHATSIAVGDHFQLSETANHHLIHVLRASLHESIVLFNGQGGEYETIITQIDKRAVFVEVQNFNPIERESPLKIHLGQGISRGEKMDLTIQKAVELGVTEITPLITERCGVKLTHDRWEKRLEHWNKIIISACEQCGRNTLPKLYAPLSLDNWIGQCSYKTRIILHPVAHQTLAQLKLSQDIGLLSGPEGGFTEPEILLAEKYSFHPVRLGSRILRTETAALAMLAALQTSIGDFSL